MNFSPSPFKHTLKKETKQTKKPQIKISAPSLQYDETVPFPDKVPTGLSSQHIENSVLVPHLAAVRADITTSTTQVCQVAIMVSFHPFTGNKGWVEDLQNIKREQEVWQNGAIPEKRGTQGTALEMRSLNAPSCSWHYLHLLNVQVLTKLVIWDLH